MNVKYNVVSNDDEQTSVTVFFGRDILLATKDHPNFGRIVNALETGEDNVDTLHALFDVGVAIVKNFEHLSERVTVSHGKLYLDGDEMDTALSQAILRFHAEGNDDFKPLVAFLEKLAQNPNPVSVQQLFRWLRDKHYAFAPDGDFIAYKGVFTSGKGMYESVNAGTAFVNGAVMKGKIPNKPDTIIEMPRSKVTFDPKQGCSTGLHAGNWRYAKEFSQGAVLRVKINPRDVVSVPTDSNDEKLRVCRYKVLNIVTAEDTQSLYVPDLERTAKVVVKPAPKPVAVPAVAVPEKAEKPKGKRTAQKAFPEYYEQFTKTHFEMLTVKELTWLAKEWELSTTGIKANLVARLVKEARARKKTWA